MHWVQGIVHWQTMMALANADFQRDCADNSHHVCIELFFDSLLCMRRFSTGAVALSWKNLGCACAKEMSGSGSEWF